MGAMCNTERIPRSDDSMGMTDLEVLEDLRGSATNLNMLKGERATES